MISVIITAFKEPKTIGRSVETFAKQLAGKDELLVIAPDRETLAEAEKHKKKYPFIRTIQDKGKGKSAALNLAVAKSKGNILILSDGDIYVSNNAVSELTNHLKNKKIGAVSGRPISVDSRRTMYGYWAYLLTSVAHDLRLKSEKKNKQFFCSGYLFAIRRSLMPRLNEGLLSEDGFISNYVYSKGYILGYAPRAEAYVKYPSNFSDWIKQKKRSAGGYTQIKKMTGVEMRSAKTESLGAFFFLKYISTIREFWWLTVLFAARVYLWFLIFRDVSVKKKTQKELWLRVESTK